MTKSADLGTALDEWQTQYYLTRYYGKSRDCVDEWWWDTIESQTGADLRTPGPEIPRPYLPDHRIRAASTRPT